MQLLRENLAEVELASDSCHIACNIARNNCKGGHTVIECNIARIVASCVRSFSGSFLENLDSWKRLGNSWKP